MTIFYIFFTFTILFSMKLVSLFGHEMGHATPALLLTKANVSVYLGSYGDDKNSHKISLGRFELFYKLNPITWFKGLCVTHENNIPIKRHFLIVLFGPIFSLLMGLGALIWTFSVTRPDSYITFGLFFFVSCTLDFIVNIFPNSNLFTEGEDTLKYNDGAILMSLLSFYKNNDQIEKGKALYKAKSYTEAAEIFQELSRQKPEEDFYVDASISSLYANQQFQEALLFFRESKKTRGPYTTADYIFEASLKVEMGYTDLAMEDYFKALKLNPNSIDALNNRGYLYNQTDNFEAALKDFDKIIDLDKTHAFAYNNRGFSKLNLGQLAEAIKDIKQSIILNPQNAYAYYYKGIYHYEMGDKEAALIDCEKAYQMDGKVMGLEEFMKMLK